MTLEELSQAYENMAKNGTGVKHDVLKRLRSILKRGKRASEQDLAWAKRQAAGFARPR